jgi:protein-tyrosine sulfotransferase
MLETHKSIFCGPELKQLYVFLNYLDELKRLTHKNNWHKHFYLNLEATYDASTHFIFHVLKNNLKESEILCAKDPKLTSHIQMLHKLFPRSKIIIMVRDPRASVYSYLKHLVGKNISKALFYEHLVKWNNLYENAFKHCLMIGSLQCKFIKYEDLVEQTETTMRSVAQFLEIEFTDGFLNHTKYVGNKIILEKYGWSSGQVNRSIYRDSLKPWVARVNYDKLLVSKNIRMLSRFQYKIDFENDKDGKELNGL